MKEKHQMEELIRAYMEEASGAIAQMRVAFSSRNLLACWRQGRIHRVGKLANGDEYMFHGIGCLVTRGDIRIDFDLDESGDLVGFDAWRLSSFASSFPFLYPDFQEYSLVEKGIQCLFNNEIIVKSRFSESYYQLNKIRKKQRRGR